MNTEFKVGDIVHFQAYKKRKIIEARVTKIERAMQSYGDDRTFYCLSGLSDPLTSVTTGESIVESDLFNPTDEKDAFK